MSVGASGVALQQSLGSLQQAASPGQAARTTKEMSSLCGSSCLSWLVSPIGAQRSTSMASSAGSSSRMCTCNPRRVFRLDSVLCTRDAYCRLQPIKQLGELHLGLGAAASLASDQRGCTGTTTGCATQHPHTCMSVVTWQAVGILVPCQLPVSRR